jgi:hypothetical protein
VELASLKPNRLVPGRKPLLPAGLKTRTSSSSSIFHNIPNRRILAKGQVLELLDNEFSRSSLKNRLAIANSRLFTSLTLFILAP